VQYNWRSWNLNICSDLWVTLKIVCAFVESRVIGADVVDRIRSHFDSTIEHRHILLPITTITKHQIVKMVF
jgi:hypothetical protein